MIALSTEVKLREIEKQLGSLSNQAPKVLMRAVNDTARQAQRDLFREAKKTYTTKASSFKNKDRALKIKRANQSSLQAHLLSNGEPLALYGFKVSASESATKAKVKTANGMKNLIVDNRWAFVTKMGSGHVGVFQRQGDSRLPIHEFFSVSVPQMIGNEQEVYGKLEPEFQSMLESNIQREIQRVLNK